MTRGPTAALATLSLTLSGCWSAPPFFSAAEGVTPVPEGRYFLRQVGNPDPTTAPEIFALSPQPDGSIAGRVERGAKNYRLVVVPQAGTPGRFLVQIQQDPRRRAMFALLDTRPDPDRIVVLPCDAAARTAVEKSGGTVVRDPQSPTRCAFEDRATLLAQVARADKALRTADFDLELVSATSAGRR